MLRPFQRMGNAAVRSCVSMNQPRAKGQQRFLLISLDILAAGLVLIGGELALRIMGFSAELQPIVVGSDGTSEPDDILGIVADPELRYRFKPGAMWRGRPINSLGFLGREVEPRKAKGAVHFICMGDSCTATGSPPYADRLYDCQLRKKGDPSAPVCTDCHGCHAVESKVVFEWLSGNS